MTDDGIMSYFAKIGLDSSQFLAGISQSSGGVLQFYRDVTISMGATMLIFDKVMQYGGKFIELANQASEFVSTIDKLSTTTGMSVEELQRFSNVARYADSDITTLASSINRMQINLSSQTAEGDKVRKMLDDMGVSYKNSDGSLKSSAELFPAIIEGMRNLENSSDRVTAANAIFGRSYQSLSGYLNMTKSEMKEYFDSANVLTDAQTQKLRDYEGSVKDLNSSVTNLSNSIGSELAPSFTEFAQLLNDAAGNEGITAFFSDLDVFLTDVARGFHIMGAEAQIAYDVLTFNSSAADKDRNALSSWIGQKTRDDAMKAAGYKTDGYGNVLAEDKTAADKKLQQDAADAAATAEKDRVSALVAAYKEYENEIKKVTDAQKTRENLTKNYAEDMIGTLSDPGQAASLTKNYRRAMESTTVDTSAVTAAATEYTKIKHGEDLSTIAGTDQYTEAQAKSSGDLIFYVGDKKAVLPGAVAPAAPKKFSEWQRTLQQAGYQ